METLLQVTLDTERIRVPEILYQPHIIGSSACGLSEILEHTFAQFSPAVAENLAANVFLTGQEVRPPLFPLSCHSISRPSLFLPCSSELKPKMDQPSSPP